MPRLEVLLTNIFSRATRNFASSSMSARACALLREVSTCISPAWYDVNFERRGSAPAANPASTQHTKPMTRTDARIILNPRQQKLCLLLQRRFARHALADLGHSRVRETSAID